ncbi:MAG: M12 family metallo-peptidase [Acidobacteriota bacterium]|nr:M12 family metallo-peptidase [Acidobacteriota bacterium]
MLDLAPPVRRLAHRRYQIALLLILAAVLVSPAALPAAPLTMSGIGPLRAAPPGEKVTAPDLASPAELLRFEEDLIPQLLAVATDTTVRVRDWPVAPAQRHDVLLTRHEVYAAGARILNISATGVSEVPRSRLVFFWGTEEGDPASGVFVAIDPDRRTIEGFSQSAAGTGEVRPLVPGKPGPHLIATPEAFLAGQGSGPKPTWQCAEEDMGLTGLFRPTRELRAPSPGRNPAAPVSPANRQGSPGIPIWAAATALQTATVAIDTDHELLSLKFGNDTTAATNYLTSLFAAINVMYERDLSVQLLVGTTILRTSAAGDPYSQGSNGGSANVNQLNEFSTYWSANHGDVPRTVAAMLSGKQSSAFSASGIAWVQGLCSTSFGYSFSQMFQINYLAGDALIVGHEIGHNFGSPHTHCYSPPIDNCFNAEPGCYSGATSCPAPATFNGVPGVAGTIMSYCHLLGGCSSSMVFHPRTVALVDPNIAAASGVCIFPANTGPSISTVTPASGSTGGGTAVTIDGSNFAGGATVTLGGVAATSVNFVSSSRIVATTGAHPTGSVDVVVTNPDNGTATRSPGYFYYPQPAALSFYSLSPCRIVDTRNAAGPLGGPALAPSVNRTFVVTGTCGIPADAKALSVNATIVRPATGGFIALFPGNAFPLGTSALSFSGGQVRATNAVVSLATDNTGALLVQNGSTGSTDLLLDVNGYFK